MDETPTDKSLIRKYFGKSIEKNEKTMFGLRNDKNQFITNKLIDKKLLEKFGKYFLLLNKYKKL
jgi:hypothetical protein